jgi:outer membrane protein OmpA-like peptidoglycan-associated protein
MSRSQLKLGLLVCLVLGLADLVVLNLFLIPAVWAPSAAIAAAPGATHAEPAAKKAEPAAKKAEPAAKKPEPVAKKPEPVAKKPEPVAAKKPEPVAAKKPEPVAAKKPEPVAKKREPTVAGVKPAQPGKPESAAAPGRASVGPDGTVTATVYFAFNGYGVAVPMRRMLDRAILRPFRRARVDVVIEGYSDPLGETDYNRRLSKLRALNVRYYLLQQKLRVRRLKLKARGSTRAAPAADRNARARNRRVVVRVRKVRR